MRPVKTLLTLLAPSAILAIVPLWSCVAADRGEFTFTESFLWYASGLLSACAVTALCAWTRGRSWPATGLVVALSAFLLIPTLAVLLTTGIMHFGGWDFEPFFVLFFHVLCTVSAVLLYRQSIRTNAIVFASAVVAAVGLHTWQYDLLAASKEGNASRVRLILSVFPGSNGKEEALQAAAFYGHVQIVRLLLEHGANPNHHLPTDGSTPLHAACMQFTGPAGDRYTAIRKMLLEHGADVNAPNAHGSTPLFYAVGRPTPILRFLLDNGADIGARDHLGATCIHRAVVWCGGDTDAVQFLIANGADLSSKDSGGRTTLHYLAANEHFIDKAMLEFLLARGFDINIPDAEGATPLHVAVGRGIPDSPLQPSGWYGSEQPAKTLLTRGADVHARDKQGRTPLHHWAALSLGNPDLLELLVGSGADTAARDDDGKTPLDLAVAVGNSYTVPLLRRFGAPESAAPRHARQHSPPPASTPAPAAADPPAGGVDLIEASGIAVRGKGKVAVIGGDETTDRLWAVSLDDFSVRWELVFPPDTPMLDDIEALAPYGDHNLFVSCAQSRTKTEEKDKPERNRLAFITLTEDARRITSMRVYERLRYHLVMHLMDRGRDLFANLGAIAMNGPNRGGLNVEGMAWWKGELLLGLRSPVAKGGAVVVPIREPTRLFQPEGRQRTPTFGDPIVLPTKPGEAIRDMAADDDGILILLGDQTDAPGPGFRLVRWRPGTRELADVRVKDFGTVPRFEGIAIDPEGRLLVVQDQRLPLPETILFRLEFEKP